MPKTNGNSRNQRNNPYQLEELFIKFHHTPAGIAWRWRTELTLTTALAAVDAACQGSLPGHARIVGHNRRAWEERLDDSARLVPVGQSLGFGKSPVCVPR